MTLRDNPVKTTLAAGGQAFGAMVFEFFTPGLPQLCVNAGAEFALFDMWQLVRTLRDSGVTIILTTHYIDEAE